MPASRALLIIDVQHAFLTRNTAPAVSAIVRLVEQGDYDLFVTAQYGKAAMPHKRAMQKSLWERAYGHLHRSNQILPAVQEALGDRRVLQVAKSSRSLFGDGTRLATALRRRGVNEVHVIGFETHDCVLATAFDAFDHNFTTYVIARACASKRRSRHDAALQILRSANMLK